MIGDEKPRPRLVDVAQVAGVSVSTASRALGRGSELIGAQTRDHVREVARKLGYRVNPVARSLRLAKTKQIGMLVPSISNPFYTDLVVQVEHHLSQRGLSLLISDAEMSVTTEDLKLRSFEGGSVDGLIIVPCHESFSTPSLERTAALVPTVQLDRAVSLPHIPFVGVDDAHGVREVLGHLKERGARRIAMLSNTGSDLSSVKRVTEARRAAPEFGMELADSDVLECNHSVESARSAVSTLINGGNRWDAIVCLNDLLAIGAITELRHRGFGIPEDIMVTGFDDIQFAELMRPSVTTLRQPLAEIARQGVELLLDESDSELPKRTLVKGKLVIRQSTIPEF